MSRPVCGVLAIMRPGLRDQKAASLLAYPQCEYRQRCTARDLVYIGLCM